eukprot:392231-Rhodomonas_salina.1
MEGHLGSKRLHSLPRRMHSRMAKHAGARVLSGPLLPNTTHAPPKKQKKKRLGKIAVNRGERAVKWAVQGAASWGVEAVTSE